MTNCVNIIFSVFNYMNIAGKNLQEISFTFDNRNMCCCLCQTGSIWIGRGKQILYSCLNLFTLIFSTFVDSS